LLDDLLDLSVLENGQVSLNEQAVLLHDVLEQAVTTAQASSARGVEIRRQVDDETVQIFTDSDRLAQVFINLVTNAIKYCDSDAPVLDITVVKNGGQVVTTFTDNGSGIPEDSQTLIFEKFARLGGGDGDGAGLGLAICREIVTRLGGDIRYVPHAGGGSFEVRMTCLVIEKEAQGLLPA
ncbi:MAG: ATP-binding protein, partial [Sulfitobacter sp.]